MTGGAEARELTKVKGAEDSHYGGVYMLFPTTIVSPKPYGIYVSRLIPLEPELTLLEARKWNISGESDDWAGQEWGAALAAKDPQSGRIRLENLKTHPLETGAFRLEDIWICERIQRAMHSPHFAVGALAEGWGAEAPLMHFQQTLLDAMAAGDALTSND